MAKFVLSDGNAINSYGFRVRTEGINFSRFDANPVMLAEHRNTIDNVLGKWKNRTIEGQQLTAEPDFDDADPNAAAVKGKVDRGFVNGASIGISFDPEKMKRAPDGVWELESCELYEASVCAIPSNAAALRLYAATDGHLLQENEIKLSLSALSAEAIDNSKIEKTDMKKVILSLASLAFLDLNKAATAEGVDTNLVDAAIVELKAKYEKVSNDHAAMKLAYDALKTQADAEAKLKAEKLVSDAIAAGKIDATKKEEWTKLSLSDFALAESTLNAIPSKKALSTTVNNPSNADVAEVKTPDDFEKLSLEKQLAWKEANPEAYKKLFA